MGLSHGTLLHWLKAKKGNRFRENYMTARLEQCHALADLTLQIADQPFVSDAAHEQKIEVLKQTLRIRAIQWYISKVAPRHYGNRTFEETKVHAGVVVLPAIAQRAEREADQRVEAAEQRRLEAANNAVVETPSGLRRIADLPDVTTSIADAKNRYDPPPPSEE